MIGRLFTAIFGSANARQLNRLIPTVGRINELEHTIQNLSDEQLSGKTVEFRQRIALGERLDALLPEAFAVVRETAKRTLGQRHYDVQLLGGMVLHQGKIAEMKTGEGKTLTETLPLYLNALSGNAAHLVTPNDYLARRDAEWMAPIYQRLGITVGVIQNNMNDMERKRAYQADIVYATNSELGFDYLRDNMKFRLTDYVQRELSYAIVDEVDSILIDEARTPLIISGPADESSELYVQVNRAMPSLRKDEDYELNEKDRVVLLTEAGHDKIERLLGVTNLYAVDNMKILHHVNQALRAHTLFRRDIEYVVRDSQVLIVDEFTGRILAGRRYSDGLHQALEAKEGVTIERETQTLAAITLQNYFRLYKKLAGMTGTAATEAEEFHQIYNLSVVSIPTNVVVTRQDKLDLIFLTKKGKYKAILDDVKERYAAGQPVLIGTASVESSEILSRVLQQNGIPHEVLNAKNHAREAEIIAHAGEARHITIATNMAGRGTDIKLTDESRTCGGLYVLGTERHESRRIDNQLRGRSGRQGDPGESRFYISLEDDLIRIFAGDSMRSMMERYGGMQEDEVVESKMVSRNIEGAQEKVEKFHFETRKHLLEYDDVLNQQRIVIYRYRREMLEGAESLDGLARDLIAATLEDLIASRVARRELPSNVYDDLAEVVTRLANITKEEIQVRGVRRTDIEVFRNDLLNLVLERYALYSVAENQELFHDAQRWVMLEVIDHAWKQHMLNLDRLKEGIGLRSMGQKNPLIEYKREAFELFSEMMRGIRWEIVTHLFNLKLSNFNRSDLEREREHALNEIMLSGAEPSQAHEHPIPPKSTISRNDPCPCGSGLKYKKCCGK